MNMKDKEEMRAFFAAHAMLAVVSETQETRVATFWDWVKSLLVNYLDFSFLHVERIEIENVYTYSAERAFKYADAMLNEMNKDK